MHISEGVLSPPVLFAGAALAAAGIALGLRAIRPERLMTVALFSSAFFVASLIHVNLGLSSVHLVLSGLMGVSLGMAAFPAIFLALVLQALLFQMGGITVLGANTCIMALPAVACAVFMRPLLAARGTALPAVAAFLCGSLPILLSALLGAGALYLSSRNYAVSAISFFSMHLPIALVEGGITLIVIRFVTRVRPELLWYAAPAAQPCATGGK